MTSVVERSPFFDDAIAVFGRDGAQQLGLTIISAFAEAQARLPLQRPVSGIRLLVAETGSWVNAFAYDDTNSIDMNFSPSGAPDATFLNLEVERLVHHEVAHLAHGQQYPRFWRDSPEELFLFAAAIREGIAKYAEMSRWDYPPACDYVLNYPDEEAEKVVDTVTALLYEPPDNQPKYHYDFLFGRLGLPADGYTVGTYIVSSMVNDQGLSIEELMNLPVPAYREFAEREL